MRLWRNIRHVLWAMGITTVLVLATVECLYRAALSHLPLLPPHMNGAAVPLLLARATWAAEEGSMVLQVRRLVPWTLLRVLTAILRARKGNSASSEGFRLANQAALEWTLKVEGQKRSLHSAVERLGLSIWITRNWSAEELIAFHSEYVRLGHGVSGFWAGAWVYLGKDWRQLDAADAALLAGIPQSPSRLDPWCYPERALRRRNAVLRKMRQFGFIHATEEATALAAPLRLAPQPARWRACLA